MKFSKLKWGACALLLLTLTAVGISQFLLPGNSVNIAAGKKDAELSGPVSVVQNGTYNDAVAGLDLGPTSAAAPYVVRYSTQYPNGKPHVVKTILANQGEFKTEGGNYTLYQYYRDNGTLDHDTLQNPHLHFLGGLAKFRIRFFDKQGQALEAKFIDPRIKYAHPAGFLIILLIVPVLWFAKTRRSSLGHSQVGLHNNIRSFPLLKWIPTILMVWLVVGMALTTAQPQITHTINRHVLARNFVVTVDVSGSMSSALTDPDLQKFAAKGQDKKPAVDPNTEIGAYLQQFGFDDSDGEDGPTQPKGPTRAMAAREGVKEFLDHREGDRVALLTFDDQVYFSEPLGLNIKAVRNKLDDILYSGGGTNFDGPSAGSTNVGAIQASIRHFKEMTDPKQTNVLIMVTDGEDTIHPERAEELARQLQALHVKMYVIGVGESWLNKDNKMDLEKFVERDEINGLVIRAGDAQQLRDGFAKIDQLERADTQLGGTEVKDELYPVTAAGTFLIFLCLLLAAALLREEI